MKKCDVLDDPDVECMLRFQQGDEEAFAKLFCKYSSSVVNFAFRILHSQALAEEVAQDVFIQVLRWQERYQPAAKFTTWLFKIARNLCLNVVRESEYKLVERSNQPDFENSKEEKQHPEEFTDHSGRTSEEICISEEYLSQIQCVLDSLDPDELTVVELHCFEGLPYACIGEIMYRSEVAVKSLFFRAKCKLRKKLNL